MARAAAPGAGSTGVDKLLDRVLGLERAHWKKLIGGLDDDAAMELARGVGQVTLVQGVDSRPAAEQLLLADRFDDKRTSRADVDLFSAGCASSTAAQPTASPSSNPT